MKYRDLFFEWLSSTPTAKMEFTVYETPQGRVYSITVKDYYYQFQVGGHCNDTIEEKMFWERAVLAAQGVNSNVN